MNLIHVTDSSFSEDVLNADKPVLVDFWAEWCAPCKRIAPILDEIAQEQHDIVICKIDIEQNKETMKEYDVKGLPSLLLFKNGTIIGRKVGVISKEQILDFLAQATQTTES